MPQPSVAGSQETKVGSVVTVELEMEYSFSPVTFNFCCSCMENGANGILLLGCLHTAQDNMHVGVLSLLFYLCTPANCLTVLFYRLSSEATGLATN